MQIRGAGAVVVFYFFAGSWVYGSSSSAPRNQEDVLPWLFGLAILALGFFLIRFIKQSDDNNKIQWQHINQLTHDLTVMKTEHENCSNCFTHRRKEDAPTHNQYGVGGD